MADNTKIEWTEATWNPVTGCTVHSPGCTNCYAMKLAGTRLQHHPSRAGLTIDTKAGPVWTGEVRFNEQWLTQPLTWKRPRMIFVCAHGDLFHESVPDEWIDYVFAVMALAPQHTFQVLTKRSARMREWIGKFEDRPAEFGQALAKVTRSAGRTMASGLRAIDDLIWPLPNVWLGVSVEDQTRADERVPDLLATPAKVRWLSCEPLLGPVDLTRWLDGTRLICQDCGDTNFVTPDEISYVAHGGEAIALCPRCGCTTQAAREPHLDWIVAGGESGPGARPMHPDWARSLRDQCAAADVPFFFKQWGEWAPHPEGRSEGFGKFGALWTGNRFEQFHRGAHHGDVWKVGKKAAGRLLDGVEHSGFPA